MTWIQAQAAEKAVTDEKFWYVQSWKCGARLYECKSKKMYGRLVYYRRFVGWKDSDSRPIRCSTKGKRWETFSLAHELYRTDWRGYVMTHQVYMLIKQADNYEKIYGKNG